MGARFMSPNFKVVEFDHFLLFATITDNHLYFIFKILYLILYIFVACSRFCNITSSSYRLLSRPPSIIIPPHSISRSVCRNGIATSQPLLSPHIPSLAKHQAKRWLNPHF